jgi:hypothetical protein
MAMQGGGSCGQTGFFGPSPRDNRLPWCVPNAAIFTPKGSKTKTRKIPRVLHLAFNIFYLSWISNVAL